MAMKLGLIVGNRGFFPDHLCESGRRTILGLLKEEGIEVVALTPEETKFGSVESLTDAQKCAELFKAHRGEIGGVLVTLPNFGDERAVANTLRLAGLNVPVLIHAFPDAAGSMTIRDRRDSFCGKMSVCNNLVQYGIPFTLTRLHTVDPLSDSFREDLRHFMATCRVVKALRGARIGAIGARPAAFNTVRFSEKLLERSGITIETLDLYELFGMVGRLPDDAPAVAAKLEAIHRYIPVSTTPAAALLKMAKMGAAIDKWVADKQLTATAIQCWTAMEEYFGVVPCTIMSMMSSSLLPSACEVDVAGVVGMLALQAAARQPSAIVDWNNNYGGDPNKAVIFHCSNLPKEVFVDLEMDYQAIIAGTVGKENTYGTVAGRIKTGAVTFCRVSTDDLKGRITAYVGEGSMTADPIDTFGGYGVIEIPKMQELIRHICENGFEHHVAVNMAEAGRAVHEALSRYLGWDVYYHGA
jgi:L-fucose isomerase-like protein